MPREAKEELLLSQWSQCFPVWLNGLAAMSRLAARPGDLPEGPGDRFHTSTQRTFCLSAGWLRNCWTDLNEPWQVDGAREEEPIDPLPVKMFENSNILNNLNINFWSVSLIKSIYLLFKAASCMSIVVASASFCSMMFAKWLNWRV